MNFSGLLNIGTSKSPTSPSPKTLADREPQTQKSNAIFKKKKLKIAP